MSVFLNPPHTPLTRYTMGKITHYAVPLGKFARLPQSSLLRLVEVTVDDLGRPPNVSPLSSKQ
jgi:hypothetical protein